MDRQSYWENTNTSKGGVAIFISEKADVKTPNMNQDKERHCIIFFKSVLSYDPSLLLEGIWSLYVLGQCHCQLLKIKSELKQNSNFLQQQIKKESHN